MIVTSMSESEVIKEITSDLINVLKFSDYKDAKFRRLVLKSPKFPVYANSEYISPLKNRWIILYEARNKGMIGDRSLVTYIITFTTSHGIYAIMVSFIDNKPIYIFFPPHFFSRYAERMNINKSGLELMKLFFKANNNFIYDYNDGIKGSTADGIALGFVTELGNIMFKTFVSFDLLKGEQIDKYIDQNNLREEIHRTRLANELEFVK